MEAAGNAGDDSVDALDAYSVSAHSIHGSRQGDEGLAHPPHSPVAHSQRSDADSVPGEVTWDGSAFRNYAYSPTTVLGAGSPSFTPSPPAYRYAHHDHSSSSGPRDPGSQPIVNDEGSEGKVANAPFKYIIIIFIYSNYIQ